MASLTWHRKGYRVRYRLYLPDGSRRIATVERTDARAAERLRRQADTLEALTQTNALTPDLAIPFIHLGLVREEDLRRWFPRSRGSLTFDAAHLVDAYRQAYTLSLHDALPIWKSVV